MKILKLLFKMFILVPTYTMVLFVVVWGDVVVSHLQISGCFLWSIIPCKWTKLYSARVIPFKGSWIEFSTDINNNVYRRRKVTCYYFIRAIGLKETRISLRFLYRVKFQNWT
jgi:DNA-directed RNA polymerase beta subunit